MQHLRQIANLKFRALSAPPRVHPSPPPAAGCVCASLHMRTQALSTASMCACVGVRAVLCVRERERVSMPRGCFMLSVLAEALRHPS
mmetsp:Transcript_34455/g.72553  ORF Transcript_34455/g.72553 Transcript_34455/m.72553 type:complete len:87 (-) Transcript_34455:345-605(-)